MQALYEGKAKKLFSTDKKNVLRMEFKDDATAFNAEKKDVFTGKGLLNKEITSCIYQMLEKEGIKTHFIQDDDELNILVKKVDIIPIEVIARNLAAGSFCRRVGVKEGLRFRKAIIEFSYKNDDYGDPMINEDYAREMNLATAKECAYLKEMTQKVNEIQKKFFLDCGMDLIDFKLEFGRLAENPKEIVLADEFSPDTCRLWDIKTGTKMDKDRFRHNLGGLLEAYREVLNRVSAKVSI